jgi:hypothetical protein
MQHREQNANGGAFRDCGKAQVALCRGLSSPVASSARRVGGCQGLPGHGQVSRRALVFSLSAA